MAVYDFPVIRLAHWVEFKDFIRSFSENWAYRGQAKAGWILNNAIERTKFICHYKGIEKEFLAEFQRGARNYLTKDDTPEHLIEWLALMQHHGAPTRLLDLTKSPYIAAYFAYEQSLIEEDPSVAIWCMNIHYLKKRALEVIEEVFPEEVTQKFDKITEKIFERIFFESSKSFVFPVEPFRMNRRYSLQQSIFISTGVAELPLMEQLHFLEDAVKTAIVKVELPTADREEALRDLQKMNMNRASLFPDLDGYALSLRLRYETMLPPAMTLQQHIAKMENEKYPFMP